MRDYYLFAGLRSADALVRDWLVACSPDGAQRNPGGRCGESAPDFASLHPGLYEDVVVKRRD